MNSPPVPIPEDIVLPPEYYWTGNTSDRYPILTSREQKVGTVAIIKPDKLHWYGVKGTRAKIYETESYEQSFRLAYSLLLLGDEG